MIVELRLARQIIKRASQELAAIEGLCADTAIHPNTAMQLARDRSRDIRHTLDHLADRLEG